MSRPNSTGLVNASEIVLEQNDGGNIRNEQGNATNRPSSGRMQRAGVVIGEARGVCCFTLRNCCDLEARAKHKRRVLFHRLSPMSFWFAMLILAVAVIIGLFVKRLDVYDLQASLDSSLQYASELNEKSINFRDFLYWITYFTWSGRWYVQAVLNFTRGRTIGLSINYVMWSFLAAICQLMGFIVAKYNKRTIGTFDSRSAEVDNKMLVYGANLVFSILVVMYQCWKYDGWHNQTPSALVRGTIALAITFTAFYVIVNDALINDDVGSQVAIGRWIYACEIFSIFCSIVCFIPQILQHRYYKVFIGLDIFHLLFQLLGAISLFLLIIIDTLIASGFNVSQENLNQFQTVVSVEIRQIVQSILIAIMVFIIYIQLCYYWKMPTIEQIRSKVNVSDQVSVLDPAIPVNAGDSSSQGVSSNIASIPIAVPVVSNSNGRPPSVRMAMPAPRTAVEIAAAEDVAHSAARLQGWTCPVCTYANAGVQLYCLLCETPFADIVHQLPSAPISEV